jgi:hypothetical protein
MATVNTRFKELPFPSEQARLACENERRTTPVSVCRFGANLKNLMIELKRV